MPRYRSLPPHLEIRRSGFVWRRRWPRIFHGDEVHWTPSRKISLCLSLRTHVLRDAKILTRRLTEMSDVVFAADAETMACDAFHVLEADGFGLRRLHAAVAIVVFEYHLIDRIGTQTDAVEVVEK